MPRVARWVIPPCLLVALAVHLLSPMLADLRALLPEGSP